MDEVVDVNIEGVPLRELFVSTPPFERTNVVISGVDLALRVSLQAEHVTRREALRRLAQTYGLSMSVGERDGRPAFIVITKR